MRLVTRVVVAMSLAALATSCSGGDGGKSPTAATPQAHTYSGAVNGDMTFTIYTVPTTSPPNYCYATRTFSGTLKLTLTQAADGSVTGTADMISTESETGMTPVSNLCNRTYTAAAFNWNVPVTGTAANLVFSGRVVNLPGGGATATVTKTIAFAGALSGETVSGAFTINELLSSVFPDPQVATVDASGSTMIAVTLR